jgi:hypothetical protein
LPRFGPADQWRKILIFFVFIFVSSLVLVLLMVGSVSRFFVGFFQSLPLLSVSALDALAPDEYPPSERKRRPRVSDSLGNARELDGSHGVALPRVQNEGATFFHGVVSFFSQAQAEVGDCPDCVEQGFRDFVLDPVDVLLRLRVNVLV